MSCHDLYIPRATRSRLAEVPACGGRHNHARAIAFSLVGVGWPDGEVFALLRPKYDPCTFPDEELLGMIAGAHKRNPQPIRRSGSWRPQRHPKPPPFLASVPKNPPNSPALHPPTDKELRAIADVRCIGRDGVRLCASRGLLWCATICGFASWVVADATRRGMQGRRFDGKPYPKAGTLPERKTHNPAGTSTRHPVGLPEAAGARVILLVEGSADFVAAHYLIWSEKREADAGVVAMLGAGLSIPDEDLAAFAGRRVRIFPHTDPDGMTACERWAAQLVCIGADVDAFSLAGLQRTDGKGVNDLNDLTEIHPDDFETHRTVWSMIP